MQQVATKFRDAVARLETEQQDKSQIDESHVKKAKEMQLVVEEAAKGIKVLAELVETARGLTAFAEHHLQRTAVEEAAAALSKVSADDGEKEQVLGALLAFNKAWAQLQASLNEGFVAELGESCENGICVAVACMSQESITKKDIDALNTSCDTWKRVFEDTISYSYLGVRACRDSGNNEQKGICVLQGTDLNSTSNSPSAPTARKSIRRREAMHRGHSFFSIL